jgi:Protein of unknown function (DUF2637)
MRQKQRKLRELRRLRWLVLVAVIAGIGTSVTLNVMHAPDNWGAKFVATIPPAAVFTVIELMSRIPSSGRLLSLGRILASLVVGAGAMAISYTQQYAFVLHLGFGGWVAQLLPVIIDGAMGVATLSLVEVVRSARAIREELDAIEEQQEPAQLVPAAGVEPENVMRFRREYAAQPQVVAPTLRRTSALPMLPVQSDEPELKDIAS